MRAPADGYTLLSVGSTQAINGTLYNKLIKIIPQVNQTLGIPEAEFLALGRANRDNPNCP